MDFMYDGHLACMAVPVCKRTTARDFQYVARGLSSYQCSHFNPFWALEGPVHTQEANQAVYIVLKVKLLQTETNINKQKRK